MGSLREVSVTWKYSPFHEKMLSQRARVAPDAIPFEQAQTEITKILPHMGSNTVGQSDFRYEECNAYAITYVQLGNRFDIFEVTGTPLYKTAGVSDPKFILVASQGGFAKDAQVSEDYENLLKLNRGLHEYLLPVFVPRPYVANNGYFGSNLHCFTVEQMKDHSELNSEYLDEIGKYGLEPYTFFKTHSFEDPFDFSEERSGLASLRFELTSTLEAASGLGVNLAYEVGSSEHFRIARRIKEALVARLYLVYQILRAVPKDFSVNAGDFMVDNVFKAVDLKLITIRGGLLPITSQDDFISWALEHREDHGDGKPGYPLFDNNQLLVARGVSKAREQIRLSRSNSYRWRFFT